MERLLKRRDSLRLKATQATKTIGEARRQEHIEEDDLAYLIFNGKNIIREMNAVQEKLDRSEIYDDSDHLELLTEQLFKANRLLRRIELKPTITRNESTERNPSETIEPPASIITIPKFNGDLIEWVDFIELFNYSIHSNDTYNNAKKLIILKAHLGGEAAQAVEGVPCTTEGYSLARSILHERFNRPDKQREVIIGQLIDIAAVTDDRNLEKLRILIDKIAACVRILERLQVPPHSIYPILTPLIKSKLPESWRVDWARCVDKHPDPDGLPNLQKYLQHEIALREGASLMQPFVGSCGSSAHISLQDIGFLSDDSHLSSIKTIVSFPDPPPLTFNQRQPTLPSNLTYLPTGNNCDASDDFANIESFEDHCNNNAINGSVTDAHHTSMVPHTANHFKFVEYMGMQHSISMFSVPDRFRAVDITVEKAVICAAFLKKPISMNDAVQKGLRTPNQMFIMKGIMRTYRNLADLVETKRVPHARASTAATAPPDNVQKRPLVFTYCTKSSLLFGWGGCWSHVYL